MADPSSRQGSSYEEPEIREFIDELYHPEDEAMRIAVAAIRGAGLPAIQIGPGDGAILALLLAAVGARRVVEIGTLSGYSALWMLRALPTDGHLWTLEADPHHAEVARRVLGGPETAGRVLLVEGPALETLPGLEPDGPFDAVFIDADKTSYPAYAEWALANLRPGGLLAADNAFLFGYLVGRAPDGRADADEIAAMRRFHRLIAERCPTRACLPTPDGLAVALAP